MHFLPFSTLGYFLMPLGSIDGKPVLSTKEGISTPEYKSSFGTTCMCVTPSQKTQVGCFSLQTHDSKMLQVSSVYPTGYIKSVN